MGDDMGLGDGADDDDDQDEEEDEEGASTKNGLPEKKKKRLLDARTWERDASLVETANALRKELGGDLFEDHNISRDRVDDALKKLAIKFSAPDLKHILRAVSWRVETAPPVIAKIHKQGKAPVDPLHGRYASPVGDKKLVLEYEADSELKDTEQIPLLEPGGIEAFIRREVLPYTPDVWINPDPKATKIGYEVSFTRHFYKPPELRTLAQISADILALEQETEGLLTEITKGAINP